MQYRSIIRILGLLIAIFSISMVPPAFVAYWYKDGAGVPFILSFVLCVVIGFLIWYPNRQYKEELKVRDGFLIVVLFWIVLGAVGAIPFMLASNPHLNLASAMFEAFSGLTTTGATVLTGIEFLPKAILYYRQQLQWLGGMGIIVLAVAILPMLGVGGMQLYRAETPGPVKDNKMTPRIADTAKHLWYIYLALTLSCALSFYLAGMDWFDAICHAFSTVAIGGFSTYDASIGHFQSPLINAICILFLLLGAVNFPLHFAAIRGKSVSTYFRDPEFKAFLLIQAALVLICFAVLLYTNVYSSSAEALNHAAFQAVSISTTAGFATDGFAAWPLFLPILLIFSSFIGGCAGSTGGGLKVVRVLLLFLQGIRELNRLIHPRAVYAIKLGRRPVADRIVEAVWGFFAAYALVFVVIMLLLLMTGLDNITAFTATAACLNNLGPGLGEVAANFGAIPDSSKWLLIVAMVFGRLEVFTLLVLFTPAFWKD
ncbi:MAG: potassium transporter [Alteromonadaceae bacterium]|jgi:trk system potassium uptake protein TrkH|uniref:Trk system potassium uptake protein n=1 Tax=Rheinheimera aquimaris TaxID=412437 RepID=A0ABN1DID8_9GAMM|nr:MULTISPECIES: TrkH family potassium uptake protein [Rheinheimera]MBJ92645.1 potassium transporter [Alteromonadaceae bacterium]MCB5212836.1 TrkH family potassium uptake protein [Rheinheimera aquimaris]HBN89583.1 potassium transporter [Rheinheimera sp.]|tara:strand:- start:8645 stop:10096 length:1452 start_codon:yes stop_codon:yes gene_type:complete